MIKVEAYKCEVTGELFTTEKEAVIAEFRAEMKRIGMTLGAMGSINPGSIMEWLACQLEMNMIQRSKLIQVLEKFEESKERIIRNDVTRKMEDLV